MRFLPLAAGILLAASAAPALAEDFTVTVGTDSRNGVCRVYFPRDDGMELEISVRAKDSNTNISVHNIPGDWTSGNEDKAIKLHIAVDTGDAFDTQDGAYVAGFSYRAVGLFSDGAQARLLLATLRGSETYSVTFDGHDVGSFTIQQQTSSAVKDYAYHFMKTCMKDNGGSTSF